MKKAASFSFERNYKVHSSIATLVLRVVFVQLAFLLVDFSLDFIFTFFGDGDLVVELLTLFGTLLITIDLIVVIYLLLSWYFKYYIVSPHGISLNEGILFRRTTSVDIPAVRSVNVRQSFLGRIFKYGTVSLESPLLKDIYHLSNVPNPFKHASLIEKARLKVITSENSETIIPGAQ